LALVLSTVDVEEIGVDCLKVAPLKEKDVTGATSAKRMAKNFIIETLTLKNSRQEDAITASTLSLILWYFLSSSYCDSCEFSQFSVMGWAEREKNTTESSSACLLATCNDQ
jgi:hypothetical protein